MSELGKVSPQISIICRLHSVQWNILVLNDQVNGYLCDFLADLLLFQQIQVNRLDINAWKCWQMCHCTELSEYKLYMGHIHTLDLTREWIAMLHLWLCFVHSRSIYYLNMARYKVKLISVFQPIYAFLNF